MSTNYEIIERLRLQPELVIVRKRYDHWYTYYLDGTTPMFRRADSWQAAIDFAASRPHFDAWEREVCS